MLGAEACVDVELLGECLGDAPTDLPIVGREVRAKRKGCLEEQKVSHHDGVMSGCSFNWRKQLLTLLAWVTISVWGNKMRKL